MGHVNDGSFLGEYNLILVISNIIERNENISSLPAYSNGKMQNGKTVHHFTISPFHFFLGIGIENYPNAHGGPESQQFTNEHVKVNGFQEDKDLS